MVYVPSLWKNNICFYIYSDAGRGIRMTESHRPNELITKISSVKFLCNKFHPN